MSTAPPEYRGEEPEADQVRIVTVFFMIYILVSGGSFGIEDMVSSSGPGLTLLLLILLPVFWSLPMALVASELGLGAARARAASTCGRGAPSAISGVSRRPGGGRSRSSSTRRCTSCSAWATCRTGCDFSQLWFYVICWAIIAVFTLVNIFGVQARRAQLDRVLDPDPGAVRRAHRRRPGEVELQPADAGDGRRTRRSSAPAVCSRLGLAIGVWMYSGYESMSTLSGEIRNPQKVIPRALMLAVPFIIIMYVLPTVAEPRRATATGTASRPRPATATSRSSRSARRWAARRSASRCSPRPCSATSPSTSTTSPPAPGRCSRSRPTACSRSRSPS